MVIIKFGKNIWKYKDKEQAEKKFAELEQIVGYEHIEFIEEND